MDLPCADNSCIVFTVLLLIMAASCVHAIFMLHSLQPAHGGVNFILAQLYVGVYSGEFLGENLHRLGLPLFKLPVTAFPFSQQNLEHVFYIYSTKETPIW